MPTAMLPGLLLQILIVGYTPGPANIYALAMSMKYGRRKAIVMWLGLLTGFSIAVFAMALTAHFIGVAFADYIIYLKYLGAIYISYLAYKIWNSQREEKETEGDCSFLSGMLIQLTNAKILLFDLTVFGSFVLPYSNRLIDLLDVSAWLLLAGPGANMVWLLAGSFLRRFFIDYRRQISVVSAISLVLCAVYIVFA
jgi:cysteine/O-acetylserine efflux protein